jgi:hypothetical protein
MDAHALELPQLSKVMAPCEQRLLGCNGRSCSLEISLVVIRTLQLLLRYAYNFSLTGISTSSHIIIIS